MSARADLHVHSKHSDRPSEWILRRLGAPESFVAPAELYRQARAKGMDFVTITDHNSIAGCLEIADIPNTFISSEITTYFPEDGCKVHVLAHDLTEPLFADIQHVREDIYALRELLYSRGVAHSVAHPTFSVNEKLTLAHVEKLLVLFNRFEALNGTRAAPANHLVAAILSLMTPRLVEDLANQHHITPVGPEPWNKVMTGGSDDHSGRYIGSAFTLTPEATGVSEFTAHLRNGRCSPEGVSGTSLKLAHGFYQIAYSYYKDRFARGNATHSHVLDGLLQRLVTESPAQKPSGFNPMPRLRSYVLGSVRRRQLSDAERSLINEISNLKDIWTTGSKEPGEEEADARAFALSCKISHQLSYHFMCRFAAHMRNVSLLEGLQTLSSLAPVGLAIAPYLAAFVAQNKDRTLHDQVRARFQVDKGLGAEATPTRKAWITDTFDDVNGVARTIRTLANVALDRDRDLTVLTCMERDPQEERFPLRNFRPVGMFELPEYEKQRVAFPPFLEIIEYIERQEFTEIIISTPGPMGLVGLAAARILGLKATGIYHTDFPTYVEKLTEDENMGEVARRFMVWFYGQMDLIMAPSEFYRKRLLRDGLEKKRIVVLPRGVDPVQFNPSHRDPDFWHRYGCNGKFKFLYVGRMSKEKNIEHLLNSFQKLVRGGQPATLLMVGDGPLLPELRQRYGTDADIVFTGLLEGEDLAKAYASADAFVFPSTTDTFGNVVLEAQASGLPVIVSDQGGPPEIVRALNSGLIVNMSDPDALMSAMRLLCLDEGIHHALATKALANASQSAWHRILDVLWDAPVAPVPGVVGERQRTATSVKERELTPCA